MPICSCKYDYYAFWMKKMDERWINVNHSLSHPMKTEKQVVFAIILCTIELTCPFSVASMIIYNKKVGHTMRKSCLLQLVYLVII